MHKTTTGKIRDSALFLEELIDLEAEILQIAETLTEPSHKRSLKRLVKFLTKETPANLDQPVQMGYQILQLLQQPLTNEEVAGKMGKSSESVRQAIVALKLGGVQFLEAETGTFQVMGRPRKVRQTKQKKI